MAMFSGKNIVIRADASLLMGTGHIMRCITIANELRLQGANCYFVTRPHAGNIIEKIIQHEHQCLLLSEGPENYQSESEYGKWLGCSQKQDAQETLELIKKLKVDFCIVDHYALDISWERVIKTKTDNIVVIDDLANRNHVCKLLIDQNAGRELNDYFGLVPENCILLMGPKYSILRKEFSDLRNASLDRRDKINLETVLISLGGIDFANATEDVLIALKHSKLPLDCRLTVVLGNQNPWKDTISATIKTLPWHTKLLIDAKEMAQLLSDSDLVIGAAGSSAWERCALGVPTIMIVVADNQKMIAEKLSDNNAALVVSSQLDIEEKVPAYINMIVNDKDCLTNMSFNSSSLTDAKGTERVITVMGTMI